MRLGHHRFVLDRQNANPLTGEFLIFVGEIMRNPQNPLGIRPRCRGALQCVSGLRTAPATLGAALCGAVGAWGRSLGRGEERQSWTAFGHLGTTPMELQNPMELRGVWRNLQAVTSHIFPGNLARIPQQKVLDVRYLGGFQMTAQASQLRCLAVDRGVVDHPGGLVYDKRLARCCEWT